ncbi:hypothetical protein WDW86_20775 [Bdellovibrionota bacterium FG-2]
MKQVIPYKMILWFFATLALELVGFLLKGPPRDPDVLFGWEQNIGTFCVFLFWASCVLAWGRGLCVLFRLEHLGWFGAVLIGTLGASWSAMALGHLGLVGSSSSGLVVVLLLAGFGLILTQRRSQTGRTAPDLNDGIFPDFKRLLVFLLVALLLGFRLLHAFLAHGTSDPALYHLLAPRLWFDRGEIYFSENAPILFQASFWEYLFLWGNLLLGGPSGKGLIEGQLFGQWTHVLFGGGGVILALQFFLKNFFKSSVSLGFVILCGISSSSLGAIASLAKNDWGVIFWALSGGLLLLNGAVSGRVLQNVLGGIVLGVAFVSKVTLGVWIFFFLFFWCVFVSVRRPRVMGLVAIGFALGSFPILLRNYLATDNPVFPTLNFIFRSPWVSPSYQLSTQAEHGGLVLLPGLLWVRLKFFVRDSYWFWGLAFLPFVWRQICWVRSLRVLVFTSISVVLFFLFWEFRFGFLRWAGPGLVFLGVFSGWFTVLFIQRFFRSWFHQEVSLIILLLVIAASGSSFWILNNPIFSDSPSLHIRDPLVHLGGDSKAWLRMNAKPWDLIVTTGDNQLYYLSSLNVVAIRDCPDWDRVTYRLRFPWELMQVLDGWRVRYVLDSRHWETVYWGRVSYLVNLLAWQFPETIVHAGANSFVLDFYKLRAAYFRACVKSEMQEFIP